MRETEDGASCFRAWREQRDLIYFVNCPASFTALCPCSRSFFWSSTWALPGTISRSMREFSKTFILAQEPKKKGKVECDRTAGNLNTMTCTNSKWSPVHQEIFDLHVPYIYNYIENRIILTFSIWRLLPALRTSYTLRWGICTRLRLGLYCCHIYN